MDVLSTGIFINSLSLASVNFKENNLLLFFLFFILLCCSPGILWCSYRKAQVMMGIPRARDEPDVTSGFGLHVEMKRCSCSSLAFA